MRQVHQFTACLLRQSKRCQTWTQTLEVQVCPADRLHWFDLKVIRHSFIMCVLVHVKPVIGKVISCVNRLYAGEGNQFMNDGHNIPESIMFMRNQIHKCIFSLNSFYFFICFQILYILNKQDLHSNLLWQVVAPTGQISLLNLNKPHSSLYCRKAQNYSYGFKL